MQLHIGHASNGEVRDHVRRHLAADPEVEGAFDLLEHVSFNLRLYSPLIRVTKTGRARGITEAKDMAGQMVKEMRATAKLRYPKAKTKLKPTLAAAVKNARSGVQDLIDHHTPQPEDQDD